MRISSLRLASFGVFRDEQFAFPRAGDGPDLHLVVGRNEAGKTTLRNALIGALYGISARSAYAFTGTPRLLAEMEIDGATVALERVGGARKARSPEAAAALSDALARAGVEEADQYLRTQAFSHADMRRDSEAMREEGGELSRLLVQSAGGLDNLRALETKLAADLQGLFVKHANNRKNRLRQLDQAWSDAHARYEAAKLETPTHARLTREQAEAEEAERKARLSLADAEAAAGTFRALWSREAVALRIARLEGELATLPAVTLAPRAEERTETILGEEKAARARLGERAEMVTQAQDALDRLTPDEAALSASEAIEGLVREAASLASRAEEHRAQLVKAAECRTLARRLAVDSGLGAQDEDLAALVARLPTVTDRRQARREVLERDALRDRLARAEAQIAEIDAMAPPVVPQTPSAALEAALERAARLGDFAGAARACEETAAAAEEALQEAEAACAGDPFVAAPPAPSEGEAHEKAIAQAREALEQADRLVEEAAQQVSEARIAVHAASGGAVPDLGALRQARAERDSLWREIVAGRPAAANAALYEARVAAADQLADRRFEQAEAVARAEEAAQMLRRAEEAHAQRVATRKQRAADLSARQEDWRSVLCAAGFVRVPLDYAGWHARRERLKAAREAHERALAGRDDMNRSLRAVLCALNAATGRCTGPEPDDKALVGALEQAIAAAREAGKAASEAHARGTAARLAYEESQRRRQACVEERDGAADALRAWRETFAPLARRCGICVEIDIARLDDLFSACGEIIGAMRNAQDEEEAASRMERRAAAVEERANALAARLGEEGGSTAALAERLRRRLDHARHVARRIEEGREDLERRVRLREEEEAHIRALRMQLAADLADAGLDEDASHEELSSRAKASDRRRRIREELSEQLSSLETAGIDPEALRAHVGCGTEAERRTRLASLEDDVERLRAKAGEARDETVRTRQNLRLAEQASRAGDAAAARLAQTAVEHEMAEAAQAAIGLRLELAVLSAAREAFARRTGSPILSRASRIFADITGGAYDRIEADGSGETFVVAHRVADDCDVAVDGLSDGTRDQLVLSVRLAAAADTSLPFIADDLFVNADDGRAYNGFAALGRLAAGRQVFYLTHHEHLVPIAQRALGERLDVVRLSH